MDKRIKKSIKKAYVQSKVDFKSAYYKFGFDYFGPFLYGYIKWLINNIEKEKINKIFFFSRDGFMMEKAIHLFDIYEKNIEIKYVYFSRKSLRQALLWKCRTFQESLQYLSESKYISVGTLLEYYGFSEKDRKEIAFRKKLDLNEDILFCTLSKNKKIENLYLDLREKICLKSREQDKYLLQYLNQIGLNSRCAIVDIGWYGSMQYYLEKFIEEHDIEASLAGYYVGINPKKLLNGKVAGYLFDSNNFKLRKSVLCFFGVIEKFFQSTEGSTIGYECIDGVIIPSKDKYEYEDEEILINYIKELQMGALNFVQIMIGEKQNDIYVKDWAMPLIRFGKYPTLKEIRLFSFFYNTDGKKEYFVSQKKLFQYNLKELVHDLSNSTWKTGFMKSVFKLPFPYFWIYNILRK